MNAANNKTIVVLGGGIMQIPALRIARELGWRIILVDGDKRAPGRRYADHFEHIDLKQKERIEQVIAGYGKRFGVDGVFTAGTDFSATVAWVAERLGLPGIPYRTALDATDKARMRRVFKEHDVPSPAFCCVDDPIKAREALDALTLPLVVKPVDNMGARGVVKVESPDQLERAVRLGIGYSRSRKVIIEEFVEGPEFSLDAIIYRGDITVCGVADRIICFPPYFVEMGHTMPTAYDPRIVKAVTEVFCRGIKALGISDGAAKGDIKLAGTGPVVGEIAARLSGGYMSGWTFPYAYGVEVTKAALRIAVGLAPGGLKPRYCHVSAERAFISIPGTVRRVYGKREARRVPGAADLFYRAGPGSRVSFPTNNVEKCGNVISMAPDRSSAVCAAERAVRHIFLRLEPGNPETERFLFGMERPGIRCFRLEDPDNLAALRAMRTIENGGGEGRPGNIAVLSLPHPERERARDWHGMTFGEALDLVIAYTGIHLVSVVSDNMVIVGSRFWDAFCKGGAQGGVYVIDTLSAGTPAVSASAQGKEAIDEKT
jgi:biotin carboxylase